MFRKNKNQVPQTVETIEAIEKNAVNKKKLGLALFAAGSTIVAVTTAVIVAERLLASISTEGDWSSLDWGLDEEDELI